MGNERIDVAFLTPWTETLAWREAPTLAITASPLYRRRKTMDRKMDALETACRYLRNECRDEANRKLRRRLNTAHVQNYRLRKKASQLSEQLAAERSCKAILSELIVILLRRMDSALSSLRDRTEDV